MESPLQRFWDTIKPPPPDYRQVIPPEQRELRRKQRKIIFLTLGIVVVIALGGFVFDYVTSAPQRAEFQFKEGMKMMSPGRYPIAIKFFTRALEIKAQYPEAYLERGNAHRMMQEADAALADYRSAADLNPSLAAAHNGIAMIFLARNDQRHALEELNKSLQLQPNTDAYYQRGQIYEALGEHQKAIDDYTTAIADARDAPFVYLARAVAREKIGDEEGARADRLEAARISRHF